MKLGVHDLAIWTDLYTHEEVLANVVDLAQSAEKWGYHRYWMSEHHGDKQYTSSAPEIIASYISGQTETIRVGTGGIMMMHYSPLKVAEVVNTINTLAPGRMDFGVGRAPGSNMDTAQALGRGKTIDPQLLYEHIGITLDYIKGNRPDHPLYGRTLASPQPKILPEAYLLGSSGDSAREAGQKGMSYSFAQFFMNGAMKKGIFDTYKEAFQPSEFSDKPNIVVSYNVTVGETEEEAEYQAKPVDIMKILQASGQLAPIMSPEDAKNLPLSDQVAQAIEINRDTHIVGTPKQVAERLMKDKEEYGFDEIMIANFSHSHEQRKYTYESLAKELL